MQVSSESETRPREAGQRSSLQGAHNNKHERDLSATTYALEHQRVNQPTQEEVD